MQFLTGDFILARQRGRSEVHQLSVVYEADWVTSENGNIQNSRRALLRSECDATSLQPSQKRMFPATTAREAESCEEGEEKSRNWCLHESGVVPSDFSNIYRS